MAKTLNTILQPRVVAKRYRWRIFCIHQRDTSRLVRQASIRRSSMQNNTNQSEQSEIFITCLDVLCRANATVFEIDPKLASDISQAIAVLSTALQNEDFTAPKRATTLESPNKYKDPFDYCKKDMIPAYSPDSETIIDVLTNEIIRNNHQK